MTRLYSGCDPCCGRSSDGPRRDADRSSPGFHCAATKMVGAQLGRHAASDGTFRHVALTADTAAEQARSGRQSRASAGASSQTAQTLAHGQGLRRRTTCASGCGLSRCLRRPRSLPGWGAHRRPCRSPAPSTRSQWLLGVVIRPDHHYAASECAELCSISGTTLATRSMHMAGRNVNNSG